MNKTLSIAATGIMTALVAAMTMAISIYIAPTRGYFNVGEVAVYLSALFFGPYVGAFAGGVGSAISDITLGYLQYAPGTLIIKGFEGFIAGYLTHKFPKKVNKRSWRVGLVGISSTILIIAMIILFIYYQGNAELTIGNLIFELTIPGILWIILVGLMLISVVSATLKFDPELGWITFSIIISGIEMVIGYFLYELIIVGAEAYAEIPFNIGQMTVGLLVSIPVYRSLT
jgi:uncharacterized membrane protein